MSKRNNSKKNAAVVPLENSVPPKRAKHTTATATAAATKAAPATTASAAAVPAKDPAHFIRLVQSIIIDAHKVGVSFGPCVCQRWTFDWSTEHARMCCTACKKETWTCATCNDTFPMSRPFHRDLQKDRHGSVLVCDWNVFGKRGCLVRLAELVSRGQTT